MKFIVDEQLPPALAEWLRSIGHDAVHVYDLDMGAVQDTFIEQHARHTGAVIITKDEDFVQIQRRIDGARILWLRLGNVRRAALLARIAADWATIIARLDGGEPVVEVR